MKIRSAIASLLILAFIIPAVGLAQTDSGGNTGGSGTDSGGNTGSNGGNDTTNNNGTGSNTGGTVINLPNPLACDGGADVSQAQCLLMKIFSALWVLASLLTTLMVLVGAFQILTAAGNPEKMETGKRTITYAIIGFVVVILSWSITSILTSLFTSVTQ